MHLIRESIPAVACTRSVVDRALLLRVLLALAITGLLLFWLLGGVNSSPTESLIQAVVGMKDGFNDQDAGDVLVHCSRDFHETVYFLDAARFRGALLRIFLSQRDSSDGSFIWQALVDEDEIQVELDSTEEEARTGTVSAPIRFVERKRPNAKPAWTLRIDGMARREEDGTWRFFQATFKTISGRLPF